MGADVALHAVRKAVQDDDDLPADVEALVIVDAELRRFEAVADEDGRRLDRDGASSGVGVRTTSCAVQEAAAADGERSRARRTSREFEEGDLLVPAVLPGRLQPERLEPARDVERGEVVAAAARIPPLELVVGEEGDVAPEASGENSAARRPAGPERARRGRG